MKIEDAHESGKIERGSNIAKTLQMLENFCQCPALDEKITVTLGGYTDPREFFFFFYYKKQNYFEHFFKRKEKYVISCVKSSKSLLLFLYFFIFCFFLHVKFTLFQTKRLQQPVTYIPKRTWDPGQKAITK